MMFIVVMALLRFYLHMSDNNVSLSCKYYVVGAQLAHIGVIQVEGCEWQGVVLVVLVVEQAPKLHAVAVDVLEPQVVPHCGHQVWLLNLFVKIRFVHVALRFPCGTEFFIVLAKRCLFFLVFGILHALILSFISSCNSFTPIVVVKCC